jgi:microcystin-dependent protein
MTIQTTPIYGFPYPQGSDPADGPAQIGALAQKVEQVLQPIQATIEVPVGAMMMWVTVTPPVNWLLCDGHQELVADFASLAAVLGESPPGSGKITLPNLVKRYPVGATADTDRPVKTVGGAAAVALVPTQMPKHTHAVAQAGNHSHGGKTHNSDRSLQHQHYPFTTSYWAGANAAISSDPTRGQFTPDYRFPLISAAGTWVAQDRTSLDWAPDHQHVISDSGDHNHSLASAGGPAVGDPGTADTHNNEPPYLAVNFIIRAK